MRCWLIGAHRLSQADQLRSGAGRATDLAVRGDVLTLRLFVAPCRSQDPQGERLTGASEPVRTQSGESFN